MNNHERARDLIRVAQSIGVDDLFAIVDCPDIPGVMAHVVFRHAPGIIALECVNRAQLTRWRDQINEAIARRWPARED